MKLWFLLPAVLWPLRAHFHSLLTQLQTNVHGAEPLEATAAAAAFVSPAINRRGSSGDIFRGSFHPEEICLFHD